LKEEIKEKIKAYYIGNDIDEIIDCINNLQEELEDLREDNYAYHQLMKMQNKREYRSKFLKEFQEEFGTNVFPDYDEIYKRYDKVKKENERLKKDLKTLWNVCWNNDTEMTSYQNEVFDNYYDMFHKNGDDEE